MCSRNAWVVKEVFWDKKSCPWIMYQTKQICDNLYKTSNKLTF